MKASSHNITGKLFNSDKWFIINLLSRNADITDEKHVRMIEEGTPDPQLLEKGYMVDPDAEQEAYRLAYLEFLDNRKTEEVQIFYAPWYSCNFACGYCYQASYDGASGVPPVQQDVIRAFFAYIDQNFAG
ncbi:MAG: hypothetical protein EHM28_04850, partial [Spirochaetaceae bacterium]